MLNLRLKKLKEEMAVLKWLNAPIYELDKSELDCNCKSKSELDCNCKSRGLIGDKDNVYTDKVSKQLFLFKLILIK